MLVRLFTTFFKIGLFTFGGGYGMISIVKDECVDKTDWIGEEEFVDIIAIAESTPGPIAINMATYIGYKKCRLLGAVFATLGVVLPSVIVIYIISIFLKSFLQIKIISDAFYGIRIAVSIIIIRTAYKLFRDEYKDSPHKKMTVFLFVIYMALMLCINILNIDINSVSLIIFAFIISALLLPFRLKI